MEKHQIKGHQVVCSAFIKKDNKFFIAIDPMFKVWRVPGGRAEHGERLEETLIREMQEELSIKFENPKFIGWGQDKQYHFGHKRETSRLIMYFYLETDQDINMIEEECEESKWVSFEELRNIENKEGALTDLFKRNPDLNL